MGRKKFIRFEYVITSVYLLVGVFWIRFSDRLIASYSDDRISLTYFQTYKGWAYVLVTALLFFLFLKRHLKKLRKAEQKARESDSLKSIFLSNVSHEIRTPMNGILGFSELLTHNNLSTEQKSEYKRILEESSERLLLLINDLVAISSLESGTETIVYGRIKISDLLDNISEAYESPAREKGVDFSVVCSNAHKEKVVFTDKEKLTAIVSRLVKNAVKYTSEGKIIIGCRVSDNFVFIFVEDTGFGIPEAELKFIFNRFSNAYRSMNDGDEGLGLGLAISKSYAEMMGGRIRVKSEVGKGTRFSLQIPYRNLKADGLDK